MSIEDSGGLEGGAMDESPLPLEISILLINIIRYGNGVLFILLL